MGKITIILLGMLFVFSSSVFGQDFTIQGVVKDTKNQSLNDARILARDSLGEIKAYTFTTSSGDYVLKLQNEGNYAIEFSLLGYQSDTIFKTLSPQTHNIKLDKTLKISTEKLKEVLIKPDMPISIKDDTITFKVDFFTNGTEETVEDLLKKIPGLEVEKDGTIKVQNREVEKIMVEDDDFFEKGYSLLTRNMPAYPIDKVEVLKHYSNNKLLKGVEQSDKIALNLKLSENAKRVWFGNIEAGGGTQNFYKAKANLMNFGKKNKYYFLGKMSDRNSEGTDNIDRFIYSYFPDEPGNIGDNQSAQSLLNLSGPVMQFEKYRSDFNQKKLASLNAIVNPSKKMKVKANVLFGKNDNNFYSNSITHTSVDATDFTNTEDFKLNPKSLIGFGKFNMTYDLSDTREIKTETKYNHGRNSSKSTLIFNGQNTVEKLKTQDRRFDQKIKYTQKFSQEKNKKVLVLGGRFIDEKKPQTYRSNRFFFQDLFPNEHDGNKVRQSSQDHMRFAGLKAHYLNRYQDESILEIQAADEYRSDDLNSRFFIFEDQRLLDQPKSYQNHLHYEVHNLYLKGKYNLKLGTFDLSGTLGVHQLLNKKAETNNDNAHEYPFFINPLLGLNWKINSKNKVGLTYMYNTTNAGILEVYPNYILTSNRTLLKGTGDFNQFASSGGIISYQRGDWSDLFFADLSLQYNKNHDFLSTLTHLEQNYSQVQKIKTKGRENLNFQTNLNYFFEALSTNLKLKVNYTTSNYKNQVNGDQFRTIKSVYYRYGFEIRSNFEGVFDYHLGSTWTRSQIKAGRKNAYTNTESFLNLYLTFTDHFNIQARSDYYHFGHLQHQKNYYFLDIEAQYHFKNKKWRLSLSGQNLFNVDEFNDYQINDVATSITSYRLLPRMIILKIHYSFGI